MTKQEIAQAVYSHAEANYEHGGWSTIVECYSLTEIADELPASVTTAEEGIAYWGEEMAIVADVEADHQAEARACGADEPLEYVRDAWAEEG